MVNPLALPGGTVADYRRQYRELNGLAADAPIPFSASQIREIGRTLGIEDPRTLVKLRQDLRIVDEGTKTAARTLIRPTTKKRRDRIIKEIIEPAEILITSLGDQSTNGIHSDFILAMSGPDGISFARLRKQLVRLRDVASHVAEWLDMTKGPRRRDESGVRQIMVNSLLIVYLYFAQEKQATRIVSRPGSGNTKSREDGNFTAFARTCSKIILGRSIPLDSYVKVAIRNRKEKSP